MGFKGKTVTTEVEPAGSAGLTPVQAKRAPTVPGTPAARSASNTPDAPYEPLDVLVFVRGLGEKMARTMRDDDYYRDSDPEDLVDDAWALGATQDTLGESGYLLEYGSEARQRAYDAFERGFLQVWKEER